MSGKEQRVPRGLAKKFTLDAQLGKGGMGAVFRGKMPETGKPCAVKIVRTAGHQRHTRRMQREAKLLSRVRHPNLVEIFDMGFDDEVPWIAMEYIAGRTMSRLRRRGHLRDPNRVAEMFLQVTAALEALHDEGITHRDIKLGNVMVDEQWRPVLMDLGLAVNEEATRITRTGQLVGTVTYLAPELFKGVPAGPASDWWAIGICLYAILEDRYPYTQEEVYKMIGSREWEEPPEMTGSHVDHPLAVACRAMLAVDPDQRLVSREDFHAVLRGRPWVPPPPSTPAEPATHMEPPPVPRASRGAATGLGLFLICLAGAVSLNYRVRPAPRPSPSAAPTEDPDETIPGRTASGERWWRWALRQREEAAPLRARGEDHRVARLLGRALSTLSLARARDPWYHLARVELLQGLAIDTTGRRVFQAWRERLERARRDLGEALRGPGEGRMAERRRQVESLLRRAESFDDVVGLGPAAFPARSPPRNLLWAMRSFRIGELPPSVQPGLLAFGRGLSAGIDLDEWAGDLRRHPVVAIARARRYAAWTEKVPDEVRARLVETADWLPQGQGTEELWLLWMDHQVMAGVQMALAERPESRTAAGWAPHLRRRLGELPIPEDTRRLGRAWTAWFESFLANGEYRRRLRPLRQALPDLEELVLELEGPPPEGRSPGVHAYMRLLGGVLQMSFRYVLVECDRLEQHLRETRARVDWDALEAIGAGGLFEHWVPGKYEEISKPAELCRATKVTLGGPFQLVRFLDEEPSK